MTAGDEECGAGRDRGAEPGQHEDTHAVSVSRQPKAARQPLRSMCWGCNAALCFLPSSVAPHSGTVVGVTSTMAGIINY